MYIWIYMDAYTYKSYMHTYVSFWDEQKKKIEVPESSRWWWWWWWRHIRNSQRDVLCLADDDDDDEDDDIFGGGCWWFIDISWDCWDALNLYAAFCSSRTLLISSGPLDCLRRLALCAFVRAGIIEINIFLTKHSFQKLSSTKYFCNINENNSKNSNVNNRLVTSGFWFDWCANFCWCICCQVFNLMILKKLESRVENFVLNGRIELAFYVHTGSNLTTFGRLKFSWLRCSDGKKNLSTISSSYPSYYVLEYRIRIYTRIYIYYLQTRVWPPLEALLDWKSSEGFVYTVFCLSYRRLWIKAWRNKHAISISIECVVIRLLIGLKEWGR
jgi:hypothetical protein